MSQPIITQSFDGFPVEPDFAGLSCEVLLELVESLQDKAKEKSLWFGKDLSNLDEVQLRMVLIAARDEISVPQACRKMVKNLEAKMQEHHTGWEFRPDKICFD